MLGLVESLTAICAIVMTCKIAGRIPAMMLTAVAAATAAVIMPPFASWKVESTANVLTVVFQSIVGLAVAYCWRPKLQARPPVISPVSTRPRKPSLSLLAIMQSIVNRNEHLAATACEIDVCGELHETAAISEQELEQILSDVLRIALFRPVMRRLKVHIVRRPAMDQISVAAEYGENVSLPRIRILGRSDAGRPVPTKSWPAHCSAICFDNGFEHSYLISIKKLF